MTRFASRHGCAGCPMANVTFYPLGNTPCGDPALCEANCKLSIPTSVVTDTNWWVDGHAKKHRQWYLKWLSSAQATALDKLKKSDGQGPCVQVSQRRCFPDLTRPPSTIRLGTGAVGARRVDDSQTRGKPSFLCFRAKSRPTLFRTKLSIQAEKEGKKK